MWAEETDKLIDFSLIKDEVQPPPILNVKTLHQIFVILLFHIRKCSLSRILFWYRYGLYGVILDISGGPVSVTVAAGAGGAGGRVEWE